MSAHSAEKPAGRTAVVTDDPVNKIEVASGTSTSLLQRVQAYDQAAWQRMVSLYSPLVFRWCCQAGLQSADAADVGQEVFRAVARKVRDFRRDRPGDSFRGWLRSITRNKLRDFARRRLSEVPVVGGDALGQVEEWPEEDDDPGDDPADTRLLFRRAVELIRAEFEERTWRAFWQVTVEDHRPEDVAHELYISVNAVYLAKSRILRRLREEFADLIDG